MNSVESYQPTIPSGTALLGDLVDVPVNEARLSGRLPITAPPAIGGYGAATWRAFASMLVERVAELEAENEALRAGAMHPTARDLLDRFLAKLDRALPDRSPQPETVSPTLPSESTEPAKTEATAADPSGPLGSVDVAVGAVGDFDDDMVASIAGAAEDVDFWDEAASAYGLLGRVRRSLRSRRSARHTTTKTVAVEPHAPEHIARAA